MYNIRFAFHSYLIFLHSWIYTYFHNNIFKQPQLKVEVLYIEKFRLFFLCRDFSAMDINSTMLLYLNHKSIHLKSKIILLHLQIICEITNCLQRNMYFHIFIFFNQSVGTFNKLAMSLLKLLFEISHHLTLSFLSHFGFR